MMHARLFLDFFFFFSSTSRTELRSDRKTLLNIHRTIVGANAELEGQCAVLTASQTADCCRWQRKSAIDGSPSNDWWPLGRQMFVQETLRRNKFSFTNEKKRSFKNCGLLKCGQTFWFSGVAKKKNETGSFRHWCLPVSTGGRSQSYMAVSLGLTGSRGAYCWHHSDISEEKQEHIYMENNAVVQTKFWLYWWMMIMIPREQNSSSFTCWPSTRTLCTEMCRLVFLFKY